jgi:uncharacterized protein (DUF2237 family)
MRHVILSLILSLGLTGAARADEAAMRSVITAQIEAFLAEDAPRAFDFASPFIQRKFGTPKPSATWCARDIRWSGSPRT